jgi:PKD repeat protein
MPKVLIARLSLLVGCALAWAGCTVHRTEAPPVAGPSEFALSFGVSATPDSISQDGGSQSAIVVRAFDANGAPKAGVAFRLDMLVGGVPVDYGTLSFKSVVTGTDGRAMSVYTSPAPLPAGAEMPTCAGLPGNCVTISATPIGTDFGGARSEEAFIHLIPLGVILPPASTPTASFTFNPSSPSANSPVQFDASASCPGSASGGVCGSSSGSITSYDWDFGDGATASGRLASHAFALAQTYSVTLTVTNDRGVKASSTKQVSVGAGSPPTATFVYSPTSPVAMAQTYFDASESRPGIGHRIVGYMWNWGDGELSPTLSNPYQEHDYQAAGTYVVVLTVTDETGQVGTAKQTLTVH